MRDGIAISTSTIPLHAVDRAVLDGDDVGFIKLHVADGTDRILGATIVSRSAGELIGQVTQAMVAGSGVRELAQVIHPYPTESSAIGAAAQAWCREHPRSEEHTSELQSLMRHSYAVISLAKTHIYYSTA